MFHAKLEAIVTSPRFGKALAGGYEVTFWHHTYENKIEAWREDKKSDPFPSAGGGYSQNAFLSFAPTVDVYIDETDGYSVPFKALDGKEYAMHFRNGADQPLQPTDL